MAKRSVSFVDRFEDEVRFFKTWATSPLKMGAVSPTSRALSRLMVELAHPDPVGLTLELGPGTGVVTQALVDSGIPQERIVSVEYDADFAKLLKQRFPRAHIIHGDALDLDRTLGEFRGMTFSAVLSGVPLLTLSKAKRIAYVEGALDRVVAGGNMTQLSYAFKPPQEPVPGRFTVDKSKWVTFNLPPGRVWIYERVAAS
jgi:phosphatidylethanolamine/phosphatidyl-N-methylethanolamine N-methyltransferase